MARVNVGINPEFLTDQHLIAESVEITMIAGSLKKDNFIIKSDPPSKFCLGKGHINFFKNKLVYLHKRLQRVNSEMCARGFKPGTELNLDDFPSKLKNDWKPTLADSYIVRVRVVDRLNNPLKASNNFHKYKRNQIDVTNFCEKIMTHQLYEL